MAKQKFSAEQLAAYKMSLARSSLTAFILATMPSYELGWVHQEICTELDYFLQAVVEGKSPRLMLTMPPRHGKLCADDTPVLTPHGWTTHGELRAGDFVFHPSGKAVKILAVGEKDYATHRVTFTNGDQIDVHLDHEWRIYDRSRQAYRTVETRFFIEPTKFGKKRAFDTGQEGKRGHRYIYQVDHAQSLCFASKEHVLPPYALGAWLGDGTSIAPRMSMSKTDAEIIKHEFENLGVPITGEWTHKDAGVVTFSFASGIPNRRNVYSQYLKDGNLIQNKHIPEEYILDSFKNRLELLAGLIDTDGNYDAKTKRYRFTTSSKKLAEDVVSLIKTCGVDGHINIGSRDDRDRTIKTRQNVYVVSFFPTFAIPCRLPRKQNKPCPKVKRIGIVSVEKLSASKLGNCIQVDSQDGLYLVGKHLTPTHNSEIASRRFPAYVLGRYPDFNVIATSYSSDLASRMNRDVQRIIDSEEYHAIFPNTKLTGRNSNLGTQGSFMRNSDLFEIVGYSGVYRSAGVGGGITGMGCNILLIDDPFKDRATADSPTMRQNAWEWYTSTAYTRLAPGGGVIIINTRWHTDDLSGRLLEAEASGEGDKWRVVNFPAIAETDEPHRKRGEALHPERYPLDNLLKIKSAIGTRDWEALYQQHPTPEGGTIFHEEWLKFWLPKDLPTDFSGMVISWDMTFKEGDSNDFVVGQVWGRKGGDFYLLDEVRGRWGFTETVEQFKFLANKYPRATRKLVEDKANGPAVIDSLKHHISGIIPIEPDGTKTARAHAVTALFEAGNVYIPDRSLFPWVTEYISELTRFPSVAHDDQVDATTQALRHFDRTHGLSISTQVKHRMFLDRRNKLAGF
jgi:predicted phage terminase large subunit-like protein